MTDADMAAKRAQAREERAKTHVNPDNIYDRDDIVRRGTFMRASFLQIGAYDVLNPRTGLRSSKQYHFTADNIVAAVMAEREAIRFAAFVVRVLNEGSEGLTTGVVRDRVLVQEAYDPFTDFEMVAFRTRSRETGEWSTLRFQATLAGMVLAVLREEEAKLFIRFVRDDGTPRPPVEVAS